MKGLFIARDDDRPTILAEGLKIRRSDIVTRYAYSAEEVAVKIGENPDLILILDDLPDIDMPSVIALARYSSDSVFILCVGKGDTSKVIDSLDQGADDYVKVPFSLREVVARVTAMSRHFAGPVEPGSKGSMVRCGELSLDSLTHTAHLGTEELELTPTEFRLLHLLVKNQSITVPRSYIQEVVWSRNSNVNGTLKKHVQSLRRKLGDDSRNPTWILNVYGVGYRLEDGLANKQMNKDMAARPTQA